MMKTVALAIALTAALCSTAAADPLEGLWRTAADDDGHSGIIEVKKCGAQICGTLVRAFDETGAEFESKNIGRQIISATEPKGDGIYKGRIWSPDRDKTYASKLELDGDRLAVSGCVLGGMICRDGGTWARVE